jgi:LacI family transcriptional regulator
VDGIIVIPISTSGKFLDPAKKSNIPVVLLDRAFQDEAYDCVRIDNRVTAYRAVEILIKNNHKKIAFIGSDVEDTGIERYKGYREALELSGITLRDDYIKLGKFSLENGYRYMKELMRLEDRPTAVFLSNYETALGGVMALNELNIPFPEEVSVFGFDDLLVSNIVKPALWLVEQPMEALCSRGVKLLLERIADGNEAEAVKLSLGAKIREGKSIRKL